MSKKQNAQNGGDQGALDLPDRTDNNPPEPLPQGLAPAADLDAIMKTDLDAVVEKAVLELDTYSRVPAKIEGDGAAEIYQRATTLATRLKGVTDDAEARRTRHKAPYLEATKKIDGTFAMKVPGPDGKERVLKKELEAAHTSIKARLSDYDTRQYLAEEKIRTDERQRLAEEAARDGIVMAAVEEAPAIASTVRSAYGGQTVRAVVLDWEVVDEALLPRAVLSVDPAKIQALIDAGVKEIPGVALSKRVETHVKKA